MTNVNIYDMHVMVTCTDTNKSIKCQVDHFKPGDFLKVIYQFEEAKTSIILKLNYNSRQNLYIGNMAGLEFTAPAPEVIGWTRR